MYRHGGLYPSWKRARKPQPPAMNADQMMAVIRSARAGDRLRVVFADNTSGDDLKGRIRTALGVRSVRFGEMARFVLRGVAESGAWNGLRTYAITFLPGFDPEHFIGLVIGRGVFERVEIIRSRLSPASPPT